MTGAFDRSASGRRNRALFYDVDRVVYVEGGRDDKGALESFDGLFWRRVISVTRPELRLRILPRGGKDNLLALAELKSENEEDNVIIAMDRDYDGILSKCIEKNGVVYTHGYSFENDVFCADSLEELFLGICPICDDGIKVRDTIEELISEFCRDVWWAQLGDVCGGIVARKVIDRDHIPKYMMSNAYGARPKLSKSALAIDVYKSNNGSPRQKIRDVPLKREDLPHLSVGHLYATFCFRIMSYLHSLHSNTSKLTRDSVMASAIANFATFIVIKRDNVVSAHYHSVLAAC